MFLLPVVMRKHAILLRQHAPQTLGRENLHLFYFPGLTSPRTAAVMIFISGGAFTARMPPRAMGLRTKAASAVPGGFEPGLSTEALVLHASYGDVEAAFAAAHAIVALDLAMAGTAPYRSRPAVPSPASTPPVTCWNCAARPRFRTATATHWRACLAAAQQPWC
jgi:hypothetical protein